MGKCGGDELAEFREEWEVKATGVELLLENFD